MKDIETSEQTVVWGHSQGGNAALWAGILAPAYAPDVPLSGVAAIAPATDLPALLRAIEETLVGRLMSAYVLRAYSEEYPDVEFSSYASGWSGKLASDMARRCLSAPKALFAVVEALAVGGSIFTTPPTTGPLGTRLLANTPAQPLTQPLLIAQGLADDLVLPDIQERFVRSRCAAGQTLQFLRYAAQDHLSIVAPNSPLKQELIDWTADRFAGESIPGGCLVEQR
jgi:alpha-beta hydrolase superfamily lysophospholipase